MALNQEEYQSLQNTELCKFYNDHKERWDQMAIKAYQYTKGYLPVNTPIRPDDVVKVLVPVITLDQSFREFTQTKKLRQKYWATWFADLVLATCFEQNIFEGTQT